MFKFCDRMRDRQTGTTALTKKKTSKRQETKECAKLAAKRFT